MGVNFQSVYKKRAADHNNYTTERRLFMGKKKNKIAKLTEEQYVAYIAGLKNTAAIVNTDGSVLIPDGLKKEKDGKK